MRFYKLQGTITDEKWIEENENKRLQRKNIHALIRKSNEYNRKLDNQNKEFLFLSDVSGAAFSAGIILNSSADLLKLSADYVKSLGLNIVDLNVEEITLFRLSDMLRDADHEDYVEDDDEILERFGLDDLSGRYGRLLRYGENIIEEQSKKQIYQNAGKIQMDDDLIPELDRIYKGKPQPSITGHPVHYFIQTDDHDARKHASRMLMQALYSGQRIHSRRYCFLDIGTRNDPSEYQLECLYKSCDSGTIIARFTAGESAEDDYATGEIDTAIHLCEVMKRHRNHVLTIFCFPRECTKIKELLYENLGSVSIVEIKEKPASGEQAQTYLKRMAKERSIRTDKNLISMLEEDREYLGTELRDIFEEWYNRKLRTKVYPEYKQIASVKKEVAKAAPKGTAYDELMKMTGLEEPKKVIGQALDFFKAQKLFADKGMNGKRPSMHMVFTGNPGTAKTTVARLFARIMKENGLLSKGHLVEVGRGDLVGRYVGWTAKIVLKKFKEASGGVLFIDEAYSLADKRGGSFGEEAINTIVQEMENHRDELVVIFAGYPDKMEEFIQSNPGLRSRIAFHVPFADYGTEELCQIAKLQAAKLELELADDAMDKMAGLFEAARKDADFGNGRYVRNLIEKARMAQATRLVRGNVETITRKEIATIKAEDIDIPVKTKPEKETIGFRCAL